MGKLVIRKNGDFLCESVSFNNSFPSGTSVRVFASINHGNKFERVHDSAFIWVEHVTRNGFQACILRGGWGHKVNTTIDWFAFQGSQSGVHHGEAGFDLFTTGSKCSQVALPQVVIVYETFQCAGCCIFLHFHLPKTVLRIYCILRSLRAPRWTYATHLTFPQEYKYCILVSDVN